MGDLVVALGQLLENRLYPQVIGSSLVIGEGQPDELVAENVGPAAMLGREPGFPQGREGTVHGRLRRIDQTRQPVEPDPVGMARQLGEDRQYTIRPDQVVGAAGFRFRCRTRSMIHVPYCRSLFRYSEGD